MLTSTTRAFKPRFRNTTSSFSHPVITPLKSNQNTSFSYCSFPILSHTHVRFYISLVASLTWKLIREVAIFFSASFLILSSLIKIHTLSIGLPNLTPEFFHFTLPSLNSHYPFNYVSYFLFKLPTNTFTHRWILSP